jgi:hypothetical protein
VTVLFLFALFRLCVSKLGVEPVIAMPVRIRWQAGDPQRNEGRERTGGTILTDPHQSRSISPRTTSRSSCREALLSLSSEATLKRHRVVDVAGEGFDFALVEWLPASS